MTEDRILQAIGEVARTHIGWEGAIEPQMQLIEELGLDSIRMMTLALEVENHFQICLDPTQDSELITVSDLVRAIKAQLKTMS